MRFVTQGLREIIIGTVRSDAHADGRAPFLRAIDRVMSVQEGEVRVIAPARPLSTLQLLSSSGFPTELLGLTFSCHVHEYPCGQCRGCLKHRFARCKTLSAPRNHPPPPALRPARTSSRLAGKFSYASRRGRISAEHYPFDLGRGGGGRRAVRGGGAVKEERRVGKSVQDV